MTFKLLIAIHVFCMNFFYVLDISVSVETHTVNNKLVYCLCSGNSTNDETPIILNPPNYQDKFDNKYYVHLQINSKNNTLNSSNLLLGPVLDKRWENFPIKKHYYIEFEPVEVLTPFSVCTKEKLEFKIFIQNEMEKIIFDQSIKEIEGRVCQWKHYSMELKGENFIIYQNYEPISNKTIVTNFTKIRVESSTLSFWKRHLYEFQQIWPQEHTETYDLATIEEQGNLCVSLYVALTRGLSLKIKLTSGESSDTRTVNYISKIAWQNVKLNISSNGKANIAISATSENLNSTRFWLIDSDHVTLCAKQHEIQNFTLYDNDNNQTYSCEALTDDYEHLRNIFETHLKIGVNQNQVLLKWKRLENPFNVKKHIVVTYQMIEKMPCNSTKKGDTEFKYLHNNETDLKLEKLEYFAKYAINITIVSDQENITISEYVTTDISADADIEDLRMDLTFINYNLVNLSFKDCNQFNGPLNITLTLKCLDKWCLNEIQRQEINIDINNFQKNIKFTQFELQAFTNYQPQIEMNRFNKTRNKTFPVMRTNPSDPRPVENLTAEAFSNDVFLKWKAPYPPTGIVSYYIVKCGDENDFNTEFNTSPESYCATSHDFLCFKIGNLRYDTKYLITIFVKNENVKNINSSMTSLNISTGRKIVEARSNLTLKWNNSTRKFQLSWDYPHFLLSGSLFESFYIRIIDEKGNKEERETLNNTFELELKHFVLYNISVKGKNKDFSEESIIIVKIFPPLQDLKNDFPIIEQCSNSSCTLTVFDSQNEKVLKKYNINNSEIDKKLVKCSLNDIELEKDHYRWINFGGSAEIIFSLNNKTFCFSTSTSLHSEDSILVKIIITIVAIMLICLCFAIYRYFKTFKENPNLGTETPDEENSLERQRSSPSGTNSLENHNSRAETRQEEDPLTSGLNSTENETVC